MRFHIRDRIRRAFRLDIRRRDLAAREIDEELRTHVELRIAQLMAAGLPRADAERQTFARLGGSLNATIRRLQRAGWRRDTRVTIREHMDALRGDAVYVSRTTRRHRGVSLVILLTFGLGIGANATMFGVIDRLLLQPPPRVGDPATLFELSRELQDDGAVRHANYFQYPLYARLRADSAAIREIAAHSFISRQSLGTGVDAAEVSVVFASSNFFSVLRTGHALGRLFGPTEDGERPVSDVAVLSYGFWQRHFGGDRDVLGKTVHVGPRDFVVIGVAEEGFTGVDPQRVDLWLPLSQADVFGVARAPWAEKWGLIWLRILVRLRSGVDGETVAAHARTILINGLETFGDGKLGRLSAFRDVPFALRSILPSTQRDGDPQASVARLLLGVTAIVLLIGCANVASLLLARGTDRRREIAVRLALGISRWRLLRLLIAETVVLAAVGGALAIAVARWGIVVLQQTLLDDFAWTESAFDGRVLGATSALVVVTIALAGLVPAVRSSRPDIVESLKAGGREGGPSVSRLRTALMTAQTTLSVVLIVTAGLFVQSLRRAADVRLGFETTGVVAATMDVTSLGYQAPARQALYDAMRDRVAALPGVAETSVASTYALSPRIFGIQVRVPGRDSLPPAPNGFTSRNAVGAQFFSALGIRIVDGRPFDRSEMGPESRVAILSEPMARAYWPGERAVGRCIVLNADSACTTIVGVAGDARQGLRADPQFLVYVPAGPRWPSSSNVLLVRSRGGDARRLVEPVRRAMQGTAPNLPYADVATLDDVLAPEIRPWKTSATLFTLFGALALVIAAMGLYSAISYSVSQRRHEFGVRVAIGARASDVIRLVMDQAVVAALVGVAVGTAAAFALGATVGPLLFDTSPRNPLAFAVAAIAMVVTAITASFVPAWRAARVDPVCVLRGD